MRLHLKTFRCAGLFPQRRHGEVTADALPWAGGGYCDTQRYIKIRCQIALDYRRFWAKARKCVVTAPIGEVGEIA